MTRAPTGPFPHRRWPGHPREGVDFPDYTLTSFDPALFIPIIEWIAGQLLPSINLVIGVDVGGATYGSAVAYQRCCGFIEARKADGIRPEVIRNLIQHYHLGEGVVISKSIDLAGRRVVVMDDVLMTGSISLATLRLVRQLGGLCEQAVFLSELDGVGGRAALEREGVKVSTLETLPARG
jgi:adenine phosphoribosyltransferase